MRENDYTQLVGENLNYVKSLANRFRGKGVEYDDLVSEGYMAMVEAAKKYDPSRGAEFVAYAGPFIRKAMSSAIEQQAAFYRVPKDERKRVPRSASKAVSIDAPLSATNQYTLLDILINKDAELQEENAVFREAYEDLCGCIALLDEREQVVVKKFYGIGTPHITMAEIAEDLQLKRERVRQIRDKALRKISKNTKSKALKVFLRK